MSLVSTVSVPSPISAGSGKGDISANDPSPPSSLKSDTPGGIAIYEEYKRAKDAHEKAREDNEAKPKDVDEKKRTEHLWYNIARDRKATKRALAESLEIGYRNSDKHSAEINDLHKKIQVLIERLSDTKGELKDIREHADEQSASIREQFAAFRGELSDNTHHLTVIDNYIVTGNAAAYEAIMRRVTIEVARDMFYKGMMVLFAYREKDLAAIQFGAKHIETPEKWKSVDIRGNVVWFIFYTKLVQSFDKWHTFTYDSGDIVIKERLKILPFETIREYLNSMMTLQATLKAEISEKWIYIKSTCRSNGIDVPYFPGMPQEPTKEEHTWSMTMPGRKKKGKNAASRTAKSSQIQTASNKALAQAQVAAARIAIEARVSEYNELKRSHDILSDDGLYTTIVFPQPMQTFGNNVAHPRDYPYPALTEGKEVKKWKQVLQGMANLDVKDAAVFSDRLLKLNEINMGMRDIGAAELVQIAESC